MAEKLRAPQQAVVGSKTRSAGRTSISQGHLSQVVNTPKVASSPRQPGG